MALSFSRLYAIKQMKCFYKTASISGNAGVLMEIGYSFSAGVYGGAAQEDREKHLVSPNISKPISAWDIV